MLESISYYIIMYVWMSTRFICEDVLTLPCSRTFDYITFKQFILFSFLYSQRLTLSVCFSTFPVVRSPKFQASNFSWCSVGTFIIDWFQNCWKLLSPCMKFNLFFNWWQSFIIKLIHPACESHHYCNDFYSVQIATFLRNWKSAN